MDGFRVPRLAKSEISGVMGGSFEGLLCFLFGLAVDNQGSGRGLDLWSQSIFSILILKCGCWIGWTE